MQKQAVFLYACTDEHGAIHSGLECGADIGQMCAMISRRYPNAQRTMVSPMPNIQTITDTQGRIVGYVPKGASK